MRIAFGSFFIMVIMFIVGCSSGISVGLAQSQNKETASNNSMQANTPSSVDQPRAKDATMLTESNILYFCAASYAPTDTRARFFSLDDSKKLILDLYWPEYASAKDEFSRREMFQKIMPQIENKINDAKKTSTVFVKNEGWLGEYDFGKNAFATKLDSNSGLPIAAFEFNRSGVWAGFVRKVLVHLSSTDPRLDQSAAFLEVPLEKAKELAGKLQVSRRCVYWVYGQIEESDGERELYIIPIFIRIELADGTLVGEKKLNSKTFPSSAAVVGEKKSSVVSETTMSEEAAYIKLKNEKNNQEAEKLINEGKYAEAIKILEPNSVLRVLWHTGVLASRRSYWNFSFPAVFYNDWLLAVCYVKADDYYSPEKHVFVDDVLRHLGFEIEYAKKSEELSKYGDMLSKFEGVKHFAKEYYNLSKRYAALGKLDESLNWLAKAIEQGYISYGDALEGKTFSRLKKNPKFLDLISKMKEKENEYNSISRQLSEKGNDSSKDWDVLDNGDRYPNERMSHIDKLLQLVIQGAELGHDSLHMYLDAARYYSIKSDAQNAVKYLKKAIMEGLGADSGVVNDSDFNNIRGTDGYLEVLSILRMHKDNTFNH